jgi:hypothetical protein
MFVGALLFLFGPAFALLLDRKMSSAPDWVWGLAAASSSVAGLFIVLLSDPVHARILRRSQRQPVFSTIIAICISGAIGGFAWWFFVIHVHPEATVEAKQPAGLSATERPWVTVASVTSPNGIAIGEAPGVIVRYVNKGQSPALRVESRARADVLPAGIKPMFSYQDIEPGGAVVLGPEGEAIVALNPSRTPDGRSGFLQKNDFDALSAGAKVFFVHGRITYNDTAGCEHWTDFCYRLVLGGNLDVQWNAYVDHNAIDKGCG